MTVPAVAQSKEQPLPSLENTKQVYIYEIQIRGPSEERPQKRKPGRAGRGRDRATAEGGGRGRRSWRVCVHASARQRAHASVDSENKAGVFLMAESS